MMLPMIIRIPNIFESVETFLLGLFLLQVSNVSGSLPMKIPFIQGDLAVHTTFFGRQAFAMRSPLFATVRRSGIRTCTVSTAICSSQDNGKMLYGIFVSIICARATLLLSSLLLLWSFNPSWKWAYVHTYPYYLCW